MSTKLRTPTHNMLFKLLLWKGFYMFIETSSPRKKGDNAILLSRQQNGVKCLSFWYHMYGPHVDKLMITTLSNSKKGTPLWLKSGTQGNRWLNSNVTINGNKSLTNYQVMNSYVLNAQIKINMFVIFTLFLYSSTQLLWTIPVNLKDNGVSFLLEAVVAILLWVFFVAITRNLYYTVDFRLHETKVWVFEISWAQEKLNEYYNTKNSRFLFLDCNWSSSRS